MAQFTADIAGMLAVFAVAAGLVLLHRASKEAPAKLLKAAAWVLVVGGIAVGACTTLYWFKYQSGGAFDTVHMGYPGMMRAPETGMGPGTMGPSTTGPGMGSMPHGVTPRPSPADGTGWAMHHWWNGAGHMGWMGLWWFMVPVLIAAVWYALSATHGRGDGARESPEQVLKRHYANGGIDSEAYERKLEELRK